MGMVFQAYSLFPNMDVRTNVAFGLRMRGQDKATRLKRADELLELVGLDAGRPTAIRTSSRAASSSASRSPARSRSSRRCCCSTSRCRRSTRASARSCAPRSAASSSGLGSRRCSSPTTSPRRSRSLTASGSCTPVGWSSSTRPENVYRRPATAFVAEFVGAMNRLPGRIGDNGEVQVLGQRLSVTQPRRSPARRRGRGAAAARGDRGRARRGRRRRGHRSAPSSARRLRLEVTLDGGQKVLVESSSQDVPVAVGDRVGLRILADSTAVSDPGRHRIRRLCTRKKPRVGPACPPHLTPRA